MRESRFQVSSFEFRVSSFEFQVSSFRFRVLGPHNLLLTTKFCFLTTDH